MSCKLLEINFIKKNHRELMKEMEEIFFRSQELKRQ